MWKRIRELGATAALLIVLFGSLMAINPNVRERFTEMTMSGQSQNLNSSLGPVAHGTRAAMTLGADYAADNPFLFSFLVVAVVLLMLMLRN